MLSNSSLHPRPWPQRLQSLVTVLAVIVLALTTGCAATPTSSTSSTGTPAATASSPATAPTINPAGAADRFGGLPRLAGSATVSLTVTDKDGKDRPGAIVIELDGKNAPITAGNFVDLVQRGVYDGLMFHRVVRDPVPFVVQGGDPTSKDPKVPLTELGMGGFVDPATNQPRSIPLEIKPKGSAEPIYSRPLEEAGVTQPPVLTHKRGAIAMARSQMPDSASSQFYIALSDLPPLDGSYAVFGYVKEGMEIVDKIQQGDRIAKLVVISSP